MKTYKVSVKIETWKEIIVKAKDIEHAEDKAYERAAEWKGVEDVEVGSVEELPSSN